MNNWFTSDTHFHHANIIGFCNRPWKTVEEMNDGLVDKWNARVKDGDIVYHCGDFAFRHDKQWLDILDRLNGKVVLIKGNHDGKRLKTNAVRDRFELIYDDGVFAIPDKNGKLYNVWMNHFPPFGSSADPRELWRPGWEPGSRTPWHEVSLCGHVHTEWKHYGSTINVGVDMWDYQPISLDEILEYRNGLTVID